MKQSVDRILTTHTGSLPRARVLTELYARRQKGEAVDASEVDERAIGRQTSDNSVPYLARGKRSLGFRASCFALFLSGEFVRKNNLALFLINLDNLQRYLLANILVEVILQAARSHMRSRNEAANSKIDYQTALYAIRYGGAQGFARFS